MVHSVLSLKDDKNLLDAIAKSLGRKQTASEIREQRVSFIFGSVSIDSGITREQIRRQLERQDGVQSE